MKINSRQLTIYRNYVKVIIYIFTPIISVLFLIYGILALIPYHPFKHKETIIGILLITTACFIFPAIFISLIIGSILGLPILLIKDITNPEVYYLYKEPNQLYRESKDNDTFIEPLDLHYSVKEPLLTKIKDDDLEK